jgi:hypothetical protein
MTARANESVVAFHRDVTALCVDRLREALNDKTFLFDRQLRNRRWEETYETEDLTSTGICLIGIHRAGVDPKAVGLDVSRTLGALADVTRRRAYPGGLGLVLWANAVWNGLALEELLGRTGLSLARPAELVSPLTTMETAWLASGLVHELQRRDDPVARAALEVVHGDLLGRYQRDTRIFCHASDAAPPAHRLRKWVANFADQIYSVQAMAFMAKTGRSRAALDAADSCAARLIELQGSLGQWWWHYDPRDGSVAQGFPVYSVHQHAMAPMALMAVAAAGGRDDRAAVELSHAWLAKNELEFQLLDRDTGTIWRDIELEEGELSRVVRHTRSVLGWKPSDGGTVATNLKVNYETRPYEWAWCLYAGAIAEGQERDGHVV